VVDAHDGAAPLPAYSYKEPLRLAEHLDESGAVTREGIDKLIAFVRAAVVVADDKGCADMLAFATSAVRDAVNSDDVLAEVKAATEVDLEILPGEEEARLTFLAVRRWFGWSAGRLAVFDIGGGSLEIAGGSDEAPDIAWSLPVGAARLARQYFTDGATQEAARAMRRDLRAMLAADAGKLLRYGSPDRAVATSKTFRSIARICGAAPSDEGIWVRRSIPLAELRIWIPKLVGMSNAEIAELPGVSADRAHQILPGAIVAEAILDIFALDELEICPWALREGVILARLDFLGADD
jgi:exopolyphosphatase/guanosine-5'-triphosphate,3'-diphosphate pyrophosphatase